MLRSLSALRRPTSGLPAFCAFLALLLAALVPLPSAASCGALNPWFQPLTVERGDPILGTGTGVQSNQALIFTFTLVGSSPLNVIRYVTGPGNSSCVVNQEYVDTFNFAKGSYHTLASSQAVFNIDALSRTGLNEYRPQSTIDLGSNLSIVKRTTAMPVPTPANCGQTAHAWFTPSHVSRQQDLIVAAVAYPGTFVYFFFDDLNGNLVSAVRPDQAHSNCVVDQRPYRFPQVGTFEVHAAFIDQTGHYNYVDIGPLTVTP